MRPDDSTNEALASPRRKWNGMAAKVLPFSTTAHYYDHPTASPALSCTHTHTLYNERRKKGEEGREELFSAQAGKFLARRRNCCWWEEEGENEKVELGEENFDETQSLLPFFFFCVER